MNSTQNLISELNKLIDDLLKKNELLQKENTTLQAMLRENEEALVQTRVLAKSLENKNKELKIASGLHGSTEHRRLMKMQINRLMKEVDLCIAELKQQTL